MLPQLIGKQKEVVCLRPNGHTAVLGSAGSGKTIVAAYRVLYLAHSDTNHRGRTLLLTYNRCLVTYFRNLIGSTLHNVHILGYHQFALRYLWKRGKAPPNCICEQDLLRQLCEQAVSEARKSDVENPILKRPIELLEEEFQWLAQHGIMTSADYVAAERVGRYGTRIARADRPTVFGIYERYKVLRGEAGKLYDWNDVSHSVLSELEANANPRSYRHVVIDEGQDFSPMMLKSLAAAIPGNGSLTLFEDMAQQIYGNKMSWRSAGLSVRGSKGVWRLKDNYRNTRQIAKLALAIAAMPYFNNDADLVEPKLPTADGPLPALVSFPSENAELLYVCNLARRLAQTGRVSILVHDNKDVERFEQELRGELTVLSKNLKSWPSGPRMFCGTYHSAKGLEFDSVLLPGMSSTRLPHPSVINAFGTDDASTKDGHLLYVSVTRAKSILVLTYTGGLTPLLPPDTHLYQSISK